MKLLRIICVCVSHALLEELEARFCLGLSAFVLLRIHDSIFMVSETQNRAGTSGVLCMP